MKKLRISTIVGITILVLGILAFMPAQEANAAAKVKSKTKTLPADGANVAFTFVATSDAIIYSIMVDNHPTQKENLCTTFTPGDPLDGDPDECVDSGFRFLGLSINGDFYRPGNRPDTLGGSNSLAIREILGNTVHGAARIPVNKGQVMKLFFDAETTLNDVKIKVTIGYDSSWSALFY